MELNQVSNVPAVAGEVIEVEPEQQLAGLSEQQVTVLRLMAKGRTLTDAAKGANVSRMAVYRWMSSDERFAAAQAQLGREMRRGIKIDIAALAEDALLNVRWRSQPEMIRVSVWRC